MNTKSMLMFAFGAALMAAVPAAAQVANPSPAATQAARQRGPCGDPWVTIALESVYAGKVPNTGLCSIGLYANGRWNSYDQLLSEVRTKKYTFRRSRIGGNCPLSGKDAVGIFLQNALMAAGGRQLIENLQKAGGDRIFNIGKETLVAAGAAPLVQVGNDLVATCGGYRLQGGTPVRVID